MPAVPALLTAPPARRSLKASLAAETLPNVETPEPNSAVSTLPRDVGLFATCQRGNGTSINTQAPLHTIKQSANRNKGEMGPH